VTYPDSVRYLYALGNELKAGAKFGLDQMRALLEAMGQPERGQRLVHVAGTNGKGSTSAILASILQAGGLRTGLYTSPHLITPTERIQIDGKSISESDFSSAFQFVHEAAERLISERRIDAHPSYFETVTAMALEVFRERSDVAVIEVGLGGRLDATNVITPELCIITPVSWDHEGFLGNSIESIAGEKAGILKAGVPVVMGYQQTAAAEVIRRRATELNCKLIRVSDARLEILDSDAEHSNFQLDGEEYECRLPGKHQVQNAVAAILAARELGIDNASIVRGTKAARWPGRLEYLRRSPDFVLDGAHNPAGAATLADYIRQYCSNRPVWLVYGAMRDKAIGEVTEQLFPLASKVILTAPDFPRALRPEVIQAFTPDTPSAIAKTLADAIALAEEAPRDAIVFFTGSLYLVGQARELLLRTQPVS
jgi:dihydrofolate synthase / folylpolyglutamate synthase